MSNNGLCMTNLVVIDSNIRRFFNGYCLRSCHECTNFRNLMYIEVRICTWENLTIVTSINPEYRHEGVSLTPIALLVTYVSMYHIHTNESVLYTFQSDKKRNCNIRE